MHTSKEVKSVFNFTNSVQLVAPCHKELPSDLFGNIQDQHVYVVREFPLSQLLQEECLEGFIRQGSMFMLCEDRQVAHHDTAALLPTGTLVLHLTDDTYLSLGLSGRPSKQYKTKYVVTIELLGAGMRSGRPLHNRVEHALRTCPQLTMDVKITWKPRDPAVCSSSLGQYLFSEGHECYRCVASEFRQRWRMTPIPVLAHAHTDRDKIWEWLGDVACDAEVGRTDEGALEYKCPSPWERADNLTYVRITSLITQQHVHSLITKLRDLVQKGASIPWIALNLDGCKDSPVLWKNFECSSAMVQDHTQSFIFFKNGDSWYDERITHGQKLLNS